MNLLHFDVTLENGPEIRGALLSLDESSELMREVSLLQGVDRRHVVDRNLLIVRLSATTARRFPLAESEFIQLDSLSRRFPDKTVAVLYCEDYEHRLSDHVSPSTDPQPGLLDRKTELIAAIRQREMEYFAQDGKALLPKNEGYRYRLPSYDYADRFLRVGNIQNSVHVVDTIFFWMLPHLAEVTGILIDTWSIGSIALNAARRLAQYDPQRPHGLRVEMMRHYHDMRPGTRAEMLGLARAASDDYSKPFLLLYSALMTEKSFRRARLALESDGFSAEKLRALVLYRLCAEPIVANGNRIAELCDFSAVVGPWLAPSPEAEAEPSIDIDSDIYFPLVVTEEERGLTHDFPALNRAFFDEYHDAVRIHVDAKIGGQTFRHHGIFIDVVAMLEKQHFREQLADKVAELDPRPTTIVFPPNDAAEKLALFVASCLDRAGGSTRLIRSLDLSQEKTEKIDASGKGRPWAPAQLGKDDDPAILVLDDVVTTGTRMLTFQRRIRDLEYSGRIHYVVAVARMENPKFWAHLRSTLAKNLAGPPHTVIPVETLTLPDWDENTCPWCHELKLLTELVAEAPGEVSRVWMERAAVLRSARAWHGLTDDVFMTFEQAEPMTVTPGSLFIAEGTSQAAVAASVASSIQMMRVELHQKKRLDGAGFPVRSVLALSNFDRYTDAVLRSAIFRAVRPSELRRSKEADEKQRARWARRKLMSDDPLERPMRRELLVAILMDRLPRTTLDQPTLDALRAEGFAEFCDLVESGRL